MYKPQIIDNNKHPHIVSASTEQNKEVRKERMGEQLSLSEVGELYNTSHSDSVTVSRGQARMVDFDGSTSNLAETSESLQKKLMVTNRTSLEPEHSSDAKISWFDVLKEGVDLLAAVQIVDRGYRKFEDSEG